MEGRPIADLPPLERARMMNSGISGSPHPTYIDTVNIGGLAIRPPGDLSRGSGSMYPGRMVPPQSPVPPSLHPAPQGYGTLGLPLGSSSEAAYKSALYPPGLHASWPATVSPSHLEAYRQYSLGQATMYQPFLSLLGADQLPAYNQSMTSSTYHRIYDLNKDMTTGAVASDVTQQRHISPATGKSAQLDKSSEKSQKHDFREKEKHESKSQRETGKEKQQSAHKQGASKTKTPANNTGKTGNNKKSDAISKNLNKNTRKLAESNSEKAENMRKSKNVDGYKSDSSAGVKSSESDVDVEVNVTDNSSTCSENSDDDNKPTVASRLIEANERLQSQNSIAMEDSQRRESQDSLTVNKVKDVGHGNIVKNNIPSNPINVKISAKNPPVDEGMEHVDSSNSETVNKNGTSIAKTAHYINDKGADAIKDCGSNDKLNIVCESDPPKVKTSGGRETILPKEKVDDVDDGSLSPRATPTNVATAVDSKAVVTMSGASTLLMPQYQAMYSYTQENKEGPLEGRRVHAPLYTPEVGTLPSPVLSTPTLSQSQSKSRDERKYRVYSPSQSDSCSMSSQGSPQSAQNAASPTVNTKGHFKRTPSDSYKLASPPSSVHNMPITDSKLDAKAGRELKPLSIATGGHLGPGSNHASPSTPHMPYRDIAQDPGKPPGSAKFLETSYTGFSPGSKTVVTTALPLDARRLLYQMGQSHALAAHGYLSPYEGLSPRLMTEEQRKRLAETNWYLNSPPLPIPHSAGSDGVVDLSTKATKPESSVSKAATMISTTTTTTGTSHTPKSTARATPIVKKQEEKRPIKRESRSSDGKKPEDILTTSGSGSIPVGIAVARQRQQTKTEKDNGRVEGEHSLSGLSSRRGSRDQSHDHGSHRDRTEHHRDQKELLTPTSRSSSSSLTADLSSNLIVTGGSTTSAPQWPPGSSDSADIRPSLIPSFYPGAGAQSLLHPALLPQYGSPSTAQGVDPTTRLPFTPPGGFKLAQDPMTGQIFFIPTNIESLDASRMWPYSTAPGLQQQYMVQHQQNALQHQEQQRNLEFVLAMQQHYQRIQHQQQAAHDLNVKQEVKDTVTTSQHNSTTTARSITTTTQQTTTSTTNSKSVATSMIPKTVKQELPIPAVVSLAQQPPAAPFLPPIPLPGHSYPFPYPPSNIPYLAFDPDIMPPIPGLKPPTKLPETPSVKCESGLQSRGTSPISVATTSATSKMTVAGKISPIKEKVKTELDVGSKTEEDNVVNAVVGSTKSEVIQDVKPKVDVQSHVEETPASVSDTVEEQINGGNENVEKVNEIETAERDDSASLHSKVNQNDVETTKDIDDDTIKSAHMLLDIQKTSEFNRQISRDSCGEKSHNLVDNMNDFSHRHSIKADSSTLLTPVSVKTEEMTSPGSMISPEISGLDNQFMDAADGLELLSALCEKRSAESESPQKSKMTETNQAKRIKLPRKLSKPITSFLKKESFEGSEGMDAMELEMRMRLAELQKRYKEKQRQLSKLNSIKNRRESSDKESKRGQSRGPGRPKKRPFYSISTKKSKLEKPKDSNVQLDQKGKLKHDTPRKTNQSKDTTMSKSKKRPTNTKVKSTKLIQKRKWESSDSASSSDSEVEDVRFLFDDDEVEGPPKKKTPSKPKKPKLTEEKTKANDKVSTPQSKTTSTSSEKQKPMLSNSDKRKPGRPKKLTSEQGDSESDNGKKESNNWDDKNTSDTNTSPEQAKVATHIPLNEEWMRRRSERIFLSDASTPQISPPKMYNSAMGAALAQKNSRSPAWKIKTTSSRVKGVQEMTKKLKKKYSKQKVERDRNSSKGSSVGSKCSSKKSVSKVSVSLDADSSSSDDLPLSSLRNRPPVQELRSCIIQKDELRDCLSVLHFEDGLFYEGRVRAIEPPDVYGIVISGERGGRPHVMSQEELLRVAIMDVKPTHRSQLPEGRRVCAYWSQQFSCLYPGTVAKLSPNPHAKKNLIPVEFDDGDSGRIPIAHIRMLPQDMPIVSENPDPLDIIGKRRRRTASEDLLAEIKERKPSVSDTLTRYQAIEDKLQYEKSKRGPGRPPKRAKTDMDTIDENDSEDETNDDVFMEDRSKVESKEERLFGDKSESDRLWPKPHRRKSKDQNKARDRSSERKRHIPQPAKFVFNRDKDLLVGDDLLKNSSESDPTKSNNHDSMSKIRNSELSDDDSDSSDCSSTSSSSSSSFGSSSSSDDDSDSDCSSDNRHKVTMKTNEMSDQLDEPQQKSPQKDQSELVDYNAVYNVEQRRLWEWLGPCTKRPGMKGKAKKEFYKSIKRGPETLNVGDCAVFLSTGRAHLPYIGRIEGFWEGWGGNMVVRVKWFYHPEETKGGRKLSDLEGALYESPHMDENDIQTISHKCEVLKFKQYQLRKKICGPTWDNTDVYYLAGNYDPALRIIQTEPDVF
ncbi:unnamed protein product [Owenia fusiformis]|uniref:Uncharacterized protein n=1 Tax=Owenia fusiformis TaxID=6347 RepID=A0A8J1UNM7_OWEFU|nr:unnamed protein product [Owenia fusiformis]